MSDITTLKDIVNDYLQTASPSVLNQTLELEGDEASKQTLVDKLILRAANNARKWAEKKHDFSWLDVTLAGTIPLTGIGIAFDGELYEWPRYTATLVVSGTTGVLTISKNAKIPIAGGSFLLEDVDGSFVPTALALTTANYPGYILDNTVAGLDNGTYTVWWHYTGATTKWYHDIKTVQGCFLATDAFLPVRPLRCERKQRMTSRLQENIDVSIDKVPRWYGERLLLHGRRMYLYPNNDEAQYVLVDANVWAPDYVLDTDTDEFLTQGFEFMQWASIVEVNKLLQRFVARQEGNMAPPNNERDRALQELIEFDIYQNESSGDYQLD
jgi:hypothetical protein